MKKPEQPLYSTQMSEYYLSSDLYVGSRVIFNSHVFLLIDADEYAFRYMEECPQEVFQFNLFLINDIYVPKHPILSL